jgi:hypothetical protein
MNNNPFLETMQAHPDKKLKEIVESKRGDYQPGAVAAAEEILRRRKVKFTEAQPEEVEHVEMTYEEIADDIRKRKAKGQPVSSIRAYYKECGVDIDMPEIRNAHTDTSAETKPAWSLRKLRGIAFIVGIGAAIVVNMDWASSSVKTGLAWVLGLGAVTALYFLFRKK